MPSSPFATGGGQGAASVAFSPSGSLLASANSDGTVSVLSVAADGKLIPIAGSPFADGGLGPFSVAFSPSGRFLATANRDDSTVSVFSVAADGKLNPIAGSPYRTSAEPESVTFSPSGGLLAVADFNGNPQFGTVRGAVSVFSVASDGTLTQVTGSPFDAGGTGPVSVAFSPSGGLLATAGLYGDVVSVYSVAAGGGLTMVHVASDGNGEAGNGPLSVAFNPSGDLLATAGGADITNNGDLVAIDAVSSFSIRAGGNLSQVSGSPFSTGSGREPLSVAFSSSGLLAATGGTRMSVFSVAPNGKLTLVNGSPYPTGTTSTADAVAFSPSGALVATANGAANTVSVFSTAPPFTASDASLTGVARHRPKLSFKLRVAGHARLLKTITVRLPHGLSFSTDKTILANALTIRGSNGRPAKLTAKVSARVLTIGLTVPQSSAQLTLSSPGLSSSQGLVRKARRHTAGKLTFTIKATDSQHAANQVTLKLRAR